MDIKKSEIGIANANFQILSETKIVLIKLYFLPSSMDLNVLNQ